MSAPIGRDVQLIQSPDRDEDDLPASSSSVFSINLPFLGIANNNLSFKLSTNNDIALSAPNLDFSACPDDRALGGAGRWIELSMDPVTGVGGSGVEPFAAVDAIFNMGGSFLLSVVDERAVLGVDVWVDEL